MELLLSRSLIITPEGLRKAPLPAPEINKSTEYSQDFCEDFPLITGSIFVDIMSVNSKEVDVLIIVRVHIAGVEDGWMEVAQGGREPRMMSVASFQRAVRRKRYKLLPYYVSPDHSIYSC